MKKYLVILFALFILMACSDKPNNATAGNGITNSSANTGPSKAKQLVTVFFTDVLEKGDSNKLKEILSEDFISHDYPEPDANSNKASFSNGALEFLSGLSDRKVVIELEAEKDGHVFTAGYYTGKHTGMLAGVPATGKTIKVDFQDVWKEKNGKLVENWVVMDRLGLLQQIGAIPPAPKK
jgi:steroid delta-isomerase-like uncharacterized protein